MINQRFVGNQGTWTAKLTIETTADNAANSYAELLALQEELKLRSNVHTDGPIITAPPAGDEDPPIEP